MNVASVGRNNKKSHCRVENTLTLFSQICSMEEQQTSVSSAIYLLHLDRTEMVSKWWRNGLSGDMVNQGGDLFQAAVGSLASLVFMLSNCSISIH